MFDYIWLLTFPPETSRDIWSIDHIPTPLWDDEFAETHADANPGYTILD
tara:strand:+ start:788 stop:934 length:147 start_codon:yes stop_codon:yes gene_type:complete